MDSAEASMEVVASSGTTRAATSATAGAAAATAAERQLAQALLVGSVCLTIVGQFAVFESALFVSTVCFTPGVLCWHDVQALLGPPHPQHQKGGESTTFDARRGGYAQPAFEAGAGLAALPAQQREERFVRKRCALISTVLKSICVWASASLGGVVPPGRERSPTKRPRELGRRGWDPIGRNEEVLCECTRGLKPAGGTGARFVLILWPGRTSRVGLFHLAEGPMGQHSDYREGFGGGPLERVNPGRHLVFVRPEGVPGTALRNRTTMILSWIDGLRLFVSLTGVGVKQSCRMPSVVCVTGRLRRRLSPREDCRAHGPGSWSRARQQAHVRECRAHAALRGSRGPDSIGRRKCFLASWSVKFRRIGEASHPGPGPGEPAYQEWRSANITGFVT